VKITTANVLDRLPADKHCLAAVLTSYAFDPRIFEEQVLRAVLDLRSDPVNQTPRFLMEGRARLQETPVSVIADAGQRQPGRRMPYDVLEVDGEVFHPKATLLLYEDHARLQIGSGNLTDGGYGGNAELFVLLELRYSDPDDAALLRHFDEFLARCAARARHPGTLLHEAREELARRLSGSIVAAEHHTYALLDSTRDPPMLDQIFALLPEGAKIRYVGMLAPFFESDIDVPSVFDRVLELAGPDPDIMLDVGMAWDNPSPVIRQPEVPTLEEELGRLWCWRHDHDPPTVEYFVPTRILRTRYEAVDQWGKLQRWSVDEAEEARTSRRTWPVGALEAFAPARILRRVAERCALRTWLFPATTLHEGLPRHRPLHAKLIVIGFEHARKVRTLIVVGSANLSRAALLRSSDEAGNVECGLAFCVEGLRGLQDLAPPLVHVPLGLLELRERQYPEPGHNYGLCIERAIHDPAQASLVVIWDRHCSESVGLPRWELRYGKESLASGERSPAEDHRFERFTLRTDDAELLLLVGDREFSIPILVTDLARLPVRPVELEMSLHTMLLMLGGQLGHERAAALEEQVRRTMGSAAEAGLEAIFGEGFGPVDVFRAWWGACAELNNPSLSLAAFRVAIVGTLGLQAVWSRIQSAMTAEPPQLPPAAAWFYGAELLRELERVQLGPDPTADAKAAVLGPFVEQLRNDLARLAPDTTSDTCMRHVLDFYGARP
jgi:hypothetical protein